MVLMLTVGAILAVQVFDAVQDFGRAKAEIVWCEKAAQAPVGGIEWQTAMGGVSSSVQDEVRHAWNTLILSALVGLIALATAIVTGNRVVRSIRRLARAASALEVGDYRRRIKIHTGDELEALGESFNALGESLLKHEETLKEQAEMLAGMVEAARVASASLDAKECGRAIARAVCAHIGACDAAVFRKDREDGGVRVIGRSSPERHKADWKRLAAHSADSGEYLVVAEQDCGPKGQSDAILVGAPLTTGSETIGSIVARFGAGLSREDLKLGSLRADVLRAFAIHAASAVANAEVHSQTAKYSEALEDWVEHVSAVMEVTKAIASSLNLDEALGALAQATASVFATDECVIFLPDREHKLVMRAAFCSEARKEVLHSARLGPGQSISGKAFAEKRCVSCYDGMSSDDATTRTLCTDSRLRGVLSTPLLVGEEAIGVITLYCSRPRQFSQKETQLLMSIGLHAAVVVRNAKLYTMEATIAEKLQTSLVSEAPEELRGLTFAGRYMPALDEANVGGDLYDVTPLPNGNVAVVIADVSGKGLEAAIHLAACKYMFKALIYTHPDDPAAVLGELNEAVNDCFHQDFFVTAFCAVIDPDSGTVLFSNAGHPPAFLITENGNMHSHLLSTGIPLGAGYPCEYENQSITVERDDVLLLYTDGVTDAVKAGDRLELEGLHKMIFEAGRCSGAELVDRLATQLGTDFDPSRKDDVALLAVSFEGITVASAEFGGNFGGGKRSIAAEAG